MTNQEVLDKITGAFPDAVLSHSESYGMLNVEVSKENAIGLLAYLKADPTLQMNFLTDLCGVHYPEQEGKELGVVYLLHSWANNFRMRVKAFFSINEPHIATATTVYDSANWMERETYDFFGVIFDGHPDLRRILNVDTMDYFPLRKEYRLEDGTRTDKDDRFFGRDGHEGREFEHRPDRVYKLS